MKRLLLTGTLAIALVFVFVGCAFAASPESVVASTTVKTKQVLTVDTNLVDFGQLDPGQTAAPSVVTLTVQSNVNWTLVRGTDANMGVMGLTFGGAGLPVWSFPVLGTQNGAKPGGSSIDRYNVTIPWNTAPGPITSTVTYTLS